MEKISSDTNLLHVLDYFQNDLEYKMEHVYEPCSSNSNLFI